MDPFKPYAPFWRKFQKREMYEDVEEDMKSFLIKRQKIHAISDRRNTPLHLAVLENNAADVAFILNNPSINVNARNTRGRTALYLASNACEIKPEIIRSLLRKGADPNVSDFNNVTPTMQACKNHTVDILKMFYEYNADFFIRTRRHKTVLHYAIENQSEENIVFLLSLQVNPNVPDSLGNIPLVAAILQGVEIGCVLVPFTNLQNSKLVNMDVVQACLETNNYQTLKALLERDFPIRNAHRLLNSVIYQAFLKNNYRMFKLVWQYTNKRLFDSNDLIYLLNRLFHYGEIRGDFSFLKHVLTTHKKWNINIHTSNIFAKIINYVQLPCYESIEKHRKRIHFSVNKEIYILLMQFFNDHQVSLGKDDMQIFMEFFEVCEYKLDLLEILLQNKRTAIIPLTFFQGFLSNFLQANQKMFAVFLENCVHFDQNYIFGKINSFELSPDVEKYIYERFTKPMTKTRRHGLNLEVIVYQTKVKSLFEMARDAARIHIENNSTTPKEFFKNIDNLNIPKVIRDVLLYKAPIHMYP